MKTSHVAEAVEVDRREFILENAHNYLLRQAGKTEGGICHLRGTSPIISSFFPNVFLEVEASTLAAATRAVETATGRRRRSKRQARLPSVPTPVRLLGCGRSILL